MPDGDVLQPAEFSFPYLSQNAAYRMTHQDGRTWMYPSSEFETYKEQVAEIVTYQGGITEPTPDPVALWHTVVLKRCHRSREALAGVPMADVGNPIKVLHDALEGVLYEDDTQILKVCSRKVPGEANGIGTRVEPMDRSEAVA